MLQGVASNGKLYWLRSLPSDGWIYGPYVNHNHYAGLMEMLMPIPLVFLSSAALKVRENSGRDRGRRDGQHDFSLRIARRHAAFVVQMALLAVLCWAGGRMDKQALALATFLVIGVALVLWLGGGELAQRLASIHADTRTELSGGTRLTIDRDALKMFAQKPLLGWGLGVFPDVYPQFRSFRPILQLGKPTTTICNCWLRWEHWDSPPCSGFSGLFRNAIRKLKNWPQDTNGAVALAAMLGVTGILVHSFVDFNLQIPANAALFYVLCAGGCHGIKVRQVAAETSAPVRCHGGSFPRGSARRTTQAVLQGRLQTGFRVRQR